MKREETKTIKLIKEYAVITAGTIIAAAAIYFFMLPNHITAGSLSGLVLILTNYIPMSVSALTMIFNIGLLVLGFLLVGREFGGKTVYTSILLPIVMRVFEITVPNNASLTGDAFLDMLGYVLIVGIGMAILFQANASSGGLDIVAKIINKYTHIEIGKAIAWSGMCIALASVLVYDTKTVFLGVLATYLNGVVLDHFIMGFNVRKRVCIISDKREEVLQYLLHELHCGATLYEAEGAYDKKRRTEIITIVTRSEYAKILDFLKRIDGNAFVTVYTVNEVINSYRR